MTIRVDEMGFRRSLMNMGRKLQTDNHLHAPWVLRAHIYRLIRSAGSRFRLIRGEMILWS